MNANRILIPLLIVATLTYDLVLVGSLTERSRWPDVLLAVLMGLAGGQVNLATFWGVLGYRHLPWRIAIPLIVPIAWGLAFFLYAGQVSPAYKAAAGWAVHLLTQTAMLASILFVVRLCGARLLHTDLASSDRPLRLQFTLRTLFAWLTATAITLSLLKTAFENTKIAEIYFRWDQIVILGFVNTMLGLTCAWLVLDTRGLKKRLMTVLLTGGPAACVVGFISVALGISWSNNDRLVAVLALWFVSAFYSGVALVVLRVAGFRLVWLIKAEADVSSG